MNSAPKLSTLNSAPITHQLMKTTSMNSVSKWPLVVQTFHNSTYAMCGHQFQRSFVHAVPPTSRTSVGERLSFTARLTSTTRPSAISSDQDPCVVEGQLLDGPSWDEIYRVVQRDLDDDVTKMFGKTHLNEGRKSCEYVLWDEPSQFIYTYGRTRHFGKAMPALVRKILKVLNEANPQHPFDWIHVTYYPNNNTKLNYHADDEPEICENSNIWCVSFTNGAESRPVNIKSATLKPASLQSTSLKPTSLQSTSLQSTSPKPPKPAKIPKIAPSLTDLAPNSSLSTSSSLNPALNKTLNQKRKFIADCDQSSSRNKLERFKQQHALYKRKLMELYEKKEAVNQKPNQSDDDTDTDTELYRRREISTPQTTPHSPTQTIHITKNHTETEPNTVEPNTVTKNSQETNNNHTDAEETETDEERKNEERKTFQQCDVCKSPLPRGCRVYCAKKECKKIGKRNRAKKSQTFLNKTCVLL